MSGWERHGECDNCGYCCQAICNPITLEFGQAVVDDPAFAAVRGIPIRGGRAIKTLNVIDPCSMHDDDDKRCTIYDERPRTCRDFPAVPAAVFGIPCTYWFENTETGETVGGTRSPHPTEG